MAIQNIDNYIEALPKERRDWLEVFGNQWAPVKQMPGTCEACVWGEGYRHTCPHARAMNDLIACQVEVFEKSPNPTFVR